MKSRLFALLLAFVLVLSLIPAVSAQGTTCFNLSADDCTFLQDAESNAANLKSFQLNAKLDLSITGLGAFDPTTGDISITGDLSGPIMYDPALTTADSPLGGLATALNANVAMKGGGQDQSVALGLVLKDGIAYIQDPTSGQWTGMSVKSLSDALASSGMPFNPSMLMGDPSQMMQNLPMGNMADLMSQVEGLANIPGFINFERLADQDVNGQNASPYSLSVDFVPLLKSSDFANLIAAGLAASGESSTQGMTGDQLAMMIPMVLGKSTATMNVTQWYGKEDKFLHRLSFDLNANVDPSGFAAFSGGGASTAPTATSPIVFGLHLEFDVSQHNGSFDIQVPEGATMAPSSS